jgi:NAD(P)-dependent dehydrogenase (short-subunit alcohol dehydrogenase family)
MVSMQSKIIMITGAASGIGRATAHLLRQSGATIVAADKTDGGTIAQAAGLSAEDMGISLDVSAPTMLDAAAVAVIRRYGRIDGLVTCAGVWVQGTTTHGTVEDWNRAITVNLTGTMFAARAVLPHMTAAGKGAIVTIAAADATNATYGNAPYNVSKAGVVQLTKSMAIDYGAQGIRVNCVSPGYIETPMMLGMQGGRRDAYLASHLMRRGGEPDEVARAIRFLLSDEASFITGVNLPVDGGLTAAQTLHYS